MNIGPAFAHSHSRTNSLRCPLDIGRVIEINVRPGIQIQNVHSKGLKAVLKAEGLLE